MKRSPLAYLIYVVLAGFAVSPALSRAAEPTTTSDATASTTISDDQKKLDEYMGIIKLTQGLKVYNQQLGRQLIDQDRLMDELNTSIDNTEATRRQLVPLLQAMIDSLQQFVDLDLPFELPQRRARIQNLQESMNRPDISLAEKFKLVLDAYQKEVEYGSNYQTYSDFIEINGRHREVDILRWGRITLAFQTPDQETSGVWDNNTHKWIVLDKKYADGIRRAFRIARGITSKGFVTLPIPKPTRAPDVESAAFSH